jgi:hypothetical protein
MEMARSVFHKNKQPRNTWIRSPEGSVLTPIAAAVWDLDPQTRVLQPHEVRAMPIQCLLSAAERHIEPSFRSFDALCSWSSKFSQPKDPNQHVDR